MSTQENAPAPEGDEAAKKICLSKADINTEQLKSQFDISAKAIEYAKHGFSLVRIPLGKKGSIKKGWNLKPNAITTAEAASGLRNCGIGLLHAWSGTCVLDIDDFDKVEESFRQWGIDLKALCNTDDAVIIWCDGSNKCKLVYKLPLSISSLTSYKSNEHGFEFRNADSDGESTQDALPPSIHPDGQPYKWAGNGHWSALPKLPDELLALWRSFLPSGGGAKARKALVAEMQARMEPEPLQITPQVNVTPNEYGWPPGLVGRLAKHFFQSSRLPVPEICCAASLALCAGIAGRQFNISNTGLNQYILLIAETGTGKESLAEAIEKLLAEARSRMPSIAEDFIGPSNFASGQGLARALDKKPGFLSVVGEFGRKLQAYNSPRANPAQQQFKTMLLDLYGKSGKHQVFRETAYADTQNNTRIVTAPALTLLGETTPSTFYDGISIDDIADGFLPRFHVIEFKGQRPDMNPNAGLLCPPDLLEEFTRFAEVCTRMRANNSFLDVPMTTEAKALLDDFERDCAARVRAGQAEGHKQIWNRAHLKALRFAALLAVGGNPQNPKVTASDACWAIAEVQRSCALFVSKFERGETGTGDHRQLSDVRGMIRTYLRLNEYQRRTYRVSEQMFTSSVVSYGYLITRAANISSLKNHRLGAAAALQSVLKTLIASGELIRMDPMFAKSNFSSTQELFIIAERFEP